MPEGQIRASAAADSGLQCLSLMSRFFQLSLDPDQVRHDYGKVEGLFDAVDIVRCAKRAGLLARITTSNWDRLGRISLPAIGEMKGEDGQLRFVIIARIADGKLLIQNPLSAGPELKTQEEIAATWTGRLILMTHREALAGPARGFDLSWFIPAVVRYRKLLLEVLAASFFLQLLGLVSPMFFQVVTDKVLVHRGLSSLDVLVIGLSVVSIFEVLLGGLRTYVFSHTTSRIDVELGVGVFRHLMGLPLAYFGARQAGTTVARVRELENIRNFLTGSALTLVVDAVFTVIFFAVMFFYSTTLTFIVLATIPLYVGLSVLVSPLLKKRVDLKFRHGSENQAFLVEAINAAETCKAMAIEPQMERRWENLQSAYVGASFKAQSLGATAGQFAQGISKAQTVITLWLGAQEVMAGDLSIGSLIAFNMLAGRVASPILRMAQLWQDFQQMRVSVDRLGDILNTPTERTSASRSNLPAIQGPGDPRQCEVPLSPRPARWCCRASRWISSRARASARRILGLGQEHPHQADPAPLSAGIRQGLDRRRRSCPDRHRLAAPPDRRGAAGECAVQPHHPREYRAGRSVHADGGGGACRQTVGGA